MFFFIYMFHSPTNNVLLDPLENNGGGQFGNYHIYLLRVQLGIPHV